MRLIRFIVIVLFAGSLALFGYTKYTARQTVDNSAPVITCADDSVLEVPCTATKEDLLQGITATDEEDGDLTSQIIVESATNFIEKGRCRIYYAVFDSQGKVGTASRMVKYTDYTSPYFTVSEPLVFAAGTQIMILDKVQCTDAIDGDISANIELLSSTVNSDNAGVYYVDMQASNSHGDTADIELPVVIYDSENQGPTINLDTQLLRLKSGDSFKATDHVTSVTDKDGGNFTIYWKKKTTSKGVQSANISVSGSVHSAPGTYYVTYTVIDEDGHRGVAVLTVIVESNATEEAASADAASADAADTASEQAETGEAAANEQ